MPQIKDAEADLKNDAFILFHAATVSSRGIEWMDGKNASVTLSVCLMLDGKQMLRLTTISSLKYYVIRRISVCLSVAACFESYLTLACGLMMMMVSDLHW